MHLVEVEMNDYNWVEWKFYPSSFDDKKLTRFIFSRNNDEKHCILDDKKISCQTITSPYRKDEYCITSQILYSIDHQKKILFKVENGASITVGYYFQTKLKIPKSIECTEGYLFLRTDNVIPRWFVFRNEMLLPTSFIENNIDSIVIDQSTPWSFSNNALFSLAINSTSVFLTKIYFVRTSEGPWNVTVPMCVSQFELSSAIIKIDHENSLIYVICISTNMVVGFHANNGEISFKFGIEDGRVVEAGVNQDSLFLLYENTRVIQYLRESGYAGLYVIGNISLPMFPRLEISDTNIMSFVGCSRISLEKKCETPFISFWNTYKTSSTRIFYTNMLPDDTSKYSFELKSNLKGDTIFRKKNLGQGNEMHQNSYFNPVSYFVDGHLHVAYFSGAGNIAKGTCGDAFLHIFNISDDSPHIIASSLVSDMIKNERLYPRGYYASILIRFKDKLYYVLHGGLSCDYMNTHSNLFAIDLNDKVYKNLPHPNTIS
jgi:hypothetical protein